MGKVYRLYGVIAAVSVLGVLGVLGTVSAGAAHATMMSSCAKCHEGMIETGGIAHAFDNNLWYFQGQNMDCVVFNSCHANSQPGTCTDYHYVCGVASLQLRAEKALAHNDRETLRRLLRENPKYMQYDGRTLSFRDCENAVVALLPITGVV